MPESLVVHLAQKKVPESIGNKALNLRRLYEYKFRIPETWVLTWDAHHRYLKDDESVIAELKSELSKLDLSKRYAVRSSANVEDDSQSSFAGQFKSVLGIQGADNIIQAVWNIWSAVETNSVITYSNHLSDNTEQLKMAVIIQEFIVGKFAGVAFSRNPITTLDEILIEAVEGNGEQLVQEGKTPLRWVNKWGTWIEEPNTESDNDNYEFIEKVADGTNQIASQLDIGVDLEWVYDGADVYWLQMREITTGKDLQVYSNKISKGVMPGQIKPLVYSINTDITNRQWIKIITSVIGKNEFRAADLAHAFYYQTYFNMGTFGDIFVSLGLPRESLEIMLGIVPPEVERPTFKLSKRTLSLLPRIILHTFKMLTIDKQFLRDMKELRTQYQAYDVTIFQDLDEKQILGSVEQFAQIHEKTTYYTIVIQLLMQIYNSILRKLLTNNDIDFQELEMMADIPEIELYDPNQSLETLRQQWRTVPDSIKDKILTDEHVNLEHLKEAPTFKQSFDAFMEQFGHLSDSGIDFSYEPWQETPELLLELIASFDVSLEKTERLGFAELPVSGIKRLVLKPFYKRARDYRYYREMSSSLYTKGVSIYRQHFLALGNLLIEKGLSVTVDEVFYLYLEELQAYVAGERPGTQFMTLTSQRIDEMDQTKDVVLPEVIYGETPPPLELNEPREVLRGIPASQGYYKGCVRVIRSLRDFSSLQEGEVLVVPFSDVGWTPLFAKAGAVIAESGGILSHSSIVAREYNIPAVVSVIGALQLKNGASVIVDGFKGEILLHDLVDIEPGKSE